MGLSQPQKKPDFYPPIFLSGLFCFLSLSQEKKTFSDLFQVFRSINWSLMLILDFLPNQNFSVNAVRSQEFLKLKYFETVPFSLKIT